MITIRLKTIFLCACTAVAAWLLLAQTLGNVWLLLPCLVCFLALVAWGALKKMALPVALFFLPFAPLLKWQPGTISFYTVALIMIYAIYAFKGLRSKCVWHLVPALALLVLTLVVKTAYGYDIDNTYLLFGITLMLFPFLGQEGDDAYDFFNLTLFFVVGVALASITAQYLAAYPPIARYIDINTTLGVIRRSGYYGDPNFYSGHITAALGGVIILILKNEKKRKMLVLVPAAILLIYCGLLSVSKSFLVIGIGLLLFGVLNLLFQKGRVSMKVMLFLVMLLTTVFVLSSTVFTDLLSIVLDRFSDDTTLSDLTTGRTDLWFNYLNALFRDPLLLLFGKGYTKVMIGGRASHSIFIQMVFQFGLIGSAFMAAWLGVSARELTKGARIGWAQIPLLAVLCIGVFGPWLALDYLFFDEFFLFILYACAAVRFLVIQPQEEPSVDEGVEVDAILS